MSRKFTRYMAVALVVALATLLWSVAVQAQSDSVGDSLRITDYPIPDYSDLQPEGPISALVLLTEPPAADLFAGVADVFSAEVNTQVQSRALALEALQANVSATLESQFGIQTVGNLTLVENGLVVNMDASQIDAVNALPNVIAVYPDYFIELDHESSVPFIGATNVWNAAIGATGDGIQVGIIDSGIDYTHAMFGGIGTPAAYANNDPTVIEPGSFPAGNIVGGFDWSGDIPGPVNPDPDPLDCNGHGTHVAGTAGGLGVDNAGNTYSGEYSTLTSEVLESEFSIAPGVAPEADLYALKAGFCNNSLSTLAILQAYEFSLDPNRDGNPEDRLDVLNNSYGATYGTAAYLTVPSANRLVAAGITFVVSAGNSSDNFFITGAPSIADGSISVASSLDGGDGFPAVTVNEPESLTGTILSAGSAGFGPSLADVSVTGDVVTAEPLLACEPLTNGAAIAGNIALIQRGECLFTQKVLNAQNAGATAVIIYNSAGESFGLGGSDPAITIPSVGISTSDGILLATTEGVNVTLGFVLAGDTISNFTSRGPATFNGETLVLKPDVAAPGNAITSAGVGTGSGSLVLGGTSMASPHVAGVAALLLELYPDWSPSEVKAAIMNTANDDLFELPSGQGDRYGPQRVGSGRVNADSSAVTDVIAYNTLRPDRVSLSFGLVDVVGTASASQTITVQNLGDAEASFGVSVDTIIDLPGVTFSVAPDSITVPANSTATVTVSMSATAADMRNVPDPTLQLTQAFGPRFFMNEESGNIIFSATTDDENLRVPFHAAPRPASDMAATTNSLSLSPLTATTSIELGGTGVFTSGNTDNPLAGLPTDVLSLVTPLELGTVDACGDAFDPFIDVQATGGDDIQYLGVTSDYSVRSFENTFLYFGISTCGPISSLNGAFGLYDLSIYIDSFADENYDGAPDYVVYTDNLGSVLSGGLIDNDEYSISRCVLDPSLEGAGTCSAFAIYPNSAPPSIADTRVLMSDAMILPIPAALVGLTEENAAFQYYATTELAGSLMDIAFADSVYDPVNATFAFNNALGGGAPLDALTGQPTYADLPGLSIPVEYDLPSGFDVPDIMLLHHHNANGDRVEVVETSKLTQTIAAGPSGLTVTGLTPANPPVQPTFSWTHRGSETDTSVPADWYLLYLQNADGPSLYFQEWYRAEDICVGTDCEVTPGTSNDGFFGDNNPNRVNLDFGLFAGDYNAYVVPWYSDTGTDLENLAQAPFSLDLPAPDALTPINPMTNTALTTTVVSFQWEADPNANWYQLFVSDPDFQNVEYNQWNPEERTCFGDVCTVTVEIFGAGDYVWWFRGWGAGQIGEWSNNAFSIEGAETLGEIERIAPMTPTTATADADIRVMWEDVEAAEWYQVYVGTPDFQTTVVFEWVRAGSVCNFEGVCTFDRIYTGNGDYVFYVRGWNPNGVGPWQDSPLTFTVDAPAPRDVEGLFPEAGVTYDEEVFELSWVDQPAAASWYRIFVSAPDFSNVQYFNWVRGQNICQFGTCVLPLDLEPGEYVWWTQTYGPGGTTAWNPVLGAGNTFTIE